jgi:hypothetical protein
VKRILVLVALVATPAFAQLANEPTIAADAALDALNAALKQ